MKNIFILLISLFSCTEASAVIYTVSNGEGAYTYAMPNTTAAVANNAPAVTGTAGTLAEALAASAAARTTGNPAAAMAAQSTLVNAGANIVSGVVLDALAPLVNH